MNSVGEQRSDEQVKVAIRLRPDPSVRVQKCVWLSDQGDNELVVTTGAGDKKQIFVFDSVANEDASQESMYTLMGKDAVSHAMKVGHP